MDTGGYVNRNLAIPELINAFGDINQTAHKTDSYCYLIYCIIRIYPTRLGPTIDAISNPVVTSKFAN